MGEAKKRTDANKSGSSRSYVERIEKGRPNRTFSITTEADNQISELAQRLGLTRSAVLMLAVAHYWRKRQTP